MRQKKLGLFLFLFFILTQILNCMTANLLEAFIHYNLGLVFANIFRLIAMTGFLWLTLGFLFNNTKAKLQSFYFILPATLIEMIFSGYYLAVHPLPKLEVFFYWLSNISTITGAIYLFLTAETKKYQLGYLKDFFLTLVFFIPLNIFQPLAKAEESFFTFKLFHFWHFIFLGLFIIFAYGLKCYLAKQTKERQFLVIFSLATILFFHLMCRFSYVRLNDYQSSKGIFGALPFYICSMGALLLPLAIYSRNKVFQGLLFLINMPGAIIVLVYPTTGTCSLFHYNVIYFFANHILLFGITMMLPIYLEGKPNLKVLKTTGITLAIYFLVMVLINNLTIYLTNGLDPNFSFVSHSPVPLAVDKILWINFYRITFSPFYLFLLWLVQYSLSLLTYFIYGLFVRRNISSETP